MTPAPTTSTFMPTPTPTSHHDDPQQDTEPSSKTRSP
jgi:hypothetical protein